VFELAGWQCQICGIDTPQSLLKDPRHPQAPTLDHIVPFGKGKGGTHTYDNVQLLCRRCNSNKSDMVLRPGSIRDVVVVMYGRRRFKEVWSEIKKRAAEFGFDLQEEVAN
jgi:hypothetical protein